MKTIIFILIMIISTNSRGQPVLEKDGDKAFWRVDTRTPAHELPPGVLADAVNCRLDDGRVGPRLGVSSQAWGVPEVAILKGPQPFAFGQFDFYQKLVPGQSYTLTIGNWTPPPLGGLGHVYLPPLILIGTYQNGAGDFNLNNQQNLSTWFIPNTPKAFTFVATGDSLVFLQQQSGGSPATGGGFTVTLTTARKVSVCGYARFNDPTTQFDTLLLATDDWRDQAGEDGGRGRVWKIVAGNAPQLVPLNGNDIYGTTRLIPCFNAVVALRQDVERHYFSASSIKGTDLIQLNSPQAWQTGDQVLFVADQTVGSTLTGGNSPVSGSYCFVSVGANNEITLYADSALSVTYTFNAGMGRFYLERAAAFPGYGGNGAPPLIAQSNAAGDSWDEVGFLEVPEQVTVEAYNGTSHIANAPNHRLVPGDSVNYFKGLSGPKSPPMSATPENGSTPWYAYPIDTNNVILYTTQTDAIGNTGSNFASVVYGNVADYIVKTTASGQPMPPGREGFYTATNQLVVINGANNVFISNALDPLHFEPLQDQFTANLGEADSVTAVSSISGIDTLLILKQRSVFALINFSLGPNSWALIPITREYGCIAPLSVTPWGSSLYFLSRRGWDRVIQNALGTVIASEKPVSWDMKKYVDLIDWNNAPRCTGATWNNRVLVALPLKNQASPSTQNNAVLSLNILNSKLSEETFAWEGVWTGSSLNVYGFAIHPIAGEDRLTFCDYNGNANWLSGSMTDATPSANTSYVTITSTAVTRAMFKGETVQVLKGEVCWDTYAPSITVQLQMAGVNEIETLGTFTYSPTEYQIANATPYNPAAPTASGWIAPHRADYSIQAGELLVAALDTYQNTVEPLRARTRGRNPQLVITNTKGAMKLVTVELAAKPIAARGTMA